MFFIVNILFLASSPLRLFTSSPFRLITSSPHITSSPLASSPHITHAHAKKRAKVQQKMHIRKKSEKYFQK